MPRRSLIPSSTLKSLVSAFNSAKRKREKDKEIAYYTSVDASENYSYRLSSVDFNTHSRVAHIVFTETKFYRTIDRYVTRNYVKYPVYSEIKQKSKDIKKTLKLTNDVLENLNNNSDNLIRRFATEIIEALNDDDLMPSWFYLELFEQQKVDEIKKLQCDFNNFRSSSNAQIQKNNEEIDSNSLLSRCFSISLNKQENKKKNL